LSHNIELNKYNFGQLCQQVEPAEPLHDCADPADPTDERSSPPPKQPSQKAPHSSTASSNNAKTLHYNQIQKKAGVWSRILDFEGDHQISTSDVRGQLILQRICGYQYDRLESGWRLAERCFDCSGDRYTMIFFDGGVESSQIKNHEQFTKHKSALLDPQHEVTADVNICGTFTQNKPQPMIRLTRYLQQMSVLAKAERATLKYMRDQRVIDDRQAASIKNLYTVEQRKQYVLFENKLINDRLLKWRELLKE